MDLFGTTRSRLHRSHAVFTPESFVRSDLPGWERSQGVILISPRIGSRFVQYLALMEPGGRAGHAARRASSECCTCSKGEVAFALPGVASASSNPAALRFARRRRCTAPRL